MAEHRLFDRDSIEVWNVQMIILGKQIHEKRSAFLDEFIPVFQKHYDSIGNENEQVHLVYKSQLNDAPMEKLLVEYERKDAFTRYSNAGIHKDDLIFEIKGHQVKKFGSQGQQKSFLIALRLAQYEWLKEHLGVLPILLLDDIFDKLDHTRVERLMKLVANNYFGQVLVTDTDVQRVKTIFGESDLKATIFSVEDGKVEQLIESEAI